ncbi:MAG: potassium/proton antiporter [Bacteroidales bacterium]|nr:potassium/proton antiporter [Bacteroidales bacterium]
MPLALFSVDLNSGSLLLLAAILVFVAIIITKVGTRIGVPSLLLFLIVGMVAGQDGLGLKFDNYTVADTIGHFALTVILFTGGYQTSFTSIKPVLKQGILLSTVGVVLTSVITGLFIFYALGAYVGDVGLSFVGCCLIAAVMSSTDSAAVFSVLRGRKMNLKENIGSILELESGSNDPMAYVLTIVLVETLKSSTDASSGVWASVGTAASVLFIQLAVGVAVGVAVGFLAKLMLQNLYLSSHSLFYILLLSIGFLSDGFASLLNGNGLLAVYITALIIGNTTKVSFKRGIDNFFDGITWLVQLMMFLILGLLATPSAFPQVAIPALAAGIFMMLVARPISVFLCLAPFRGLSLKGKAYISWVGLKGAGPILFALYPVLAGIDGADFVFNIVFFITLLSLLIQGITLSPVAKKLNLSYYEGPDVESFGLEVPEEMGMLRDHIVTKEDLSAGKTLRDLKLPHGIRVIMIKRSQQYLVPHGSMELKPDDHLVLIIGETDKD